MDLNLDTLKDQILRALKEGEFIVFYGYSRLMDSLSVIHWDSERHPDFQLFLQAAKQAGVRLIVFHLQEFGADQIDELAEQLEEAELPLEEEQALRRRLREFRNYDRFTCSLELSFDYQGRTYAFDLRTDWYAEYLDIVDEIEGGPVEGDGDEEGPIGGYFSRN